MPIHGQGKAPGGGEADGRGAPNLKRDDGFTNGLPIFAAAIDDLLGQVRLV